MPDGDSQSGWLPPGASPAPQQPSSDIDWSWLSGAWGDVTHWFGDAGSWVAQQFTPSDEDQLTSLIYQKMGPGGLPPGQVHGPDRNFLIARRFAHQAMTDPSYRRELAQAMGWNLNNPHVKYFLEHGTNIPSDPTGTGVAPGIDPATGKPVQPASTAPAASIGAPFDASKWGGRGSDPGFTYGAVLPPDIAAAAGIDRQWGIDYALPLGTPQNSPFAGTVKEAGWNGPYGYTVVVQMSNGYTYRVAHLESIGAGITVGAPVKVGQLLGPTGSTGNSTGPHVLIEMRDSSGRPIDPTPIIDDLLKGDTAGAQKYLGDYVSAGQAIGGPFLSSDGHLIYPGSEDYNVFFATQQLWRKRYGGDPPWSFVSGLIANGNTTVEQIQGVMDQMSSDIAGMNWGQRDQFTNDANKVGGQYFSRPLPDSTIKRLAGEGITTAGQLDLWAKSHPAAAIDSAERAQIYDQLSLQVSKYWEEAPSPDMVAEIHKRMQQGPQA